MLGTEVDSQEASQSTALSSRNSPGSSTVPQNRNHWIPDSHCQECFECGRKFTTLKRRHHCRFCGRIFCSRCSAHLRDGSSIGYSGLQRACGFCAVNHEMIAKNFGKPEESVLAPTEQEHQMDSKVSLDAEKSLIDSPEQIFPSIRSEVDPSPVFACPESGFRTWHAQCSYQSPQIANLFPVVDDSLSTPRKPASSISVDGRQSLPDIQTFFALWFRMTCSNSLDQTSVDLKSSALSFFAKNMTLSRRSFSGDAQGSRATSSPACQKTIPLETVIVGSDRCSSGRQIVDWLVSSSGGRLESRERACDLCEAYTKASFLKPLGNIGPLGKFVDGSQLYRILEECQMDDSPRLSGRVQSVGSGFDALRHLFRRSTLVTESVALSKIKEVSSHKESADSTSVVMVIPLPESLGQAGTDSDEPQSRIESAPPQRISVEPGDVYAHYLERLIRQETRDHYLSPDWNALMFTTVRMLCDDVELNLRSVLLKNVQNRRNGSPSFNPSQQCSLIDNMMLQEFCPPKYSPMSVLRYIHVKKVVGADESCQILNGVALTGHLIHSHLPTQLYLPRILILASSVTYERNIYKRTWLESYAAQEEEYLGNCVTKILSFRPTVLITGGGIANIALNMLVKSGIAIFCNVKRPVLARLASATGAEIIASTDAFLSGSYDVSPKHPTSPVGACRWYKLLTLPQPNGTRKPVCIFSFTDLPALDTTPPVSWFHVPGLNLVPNISKEEDVKKGPEGKITRMPTYSVFLRGPDLATLKLAKRCLKLALLSCFNARLETAYLNDAQIVLTGDPFGTSTLNSCESDDSYSSSLARHLCGRLFNLSPLVTTKLPFLASVEGRRIPLFDFYFYLVDWPDKRRLNDSLKQKAVVMRAKIYASKKPPSMYTLPQQDSSSSLSAPDRLCSEDEKESMILRRWTGMGRIIAANASRSKKATKTPSLPSRPAVKHVNKRLSRSIRDARSHTLMHVLRSVFSLTSVICPDPCLPSWIMGIDVYGSNDLPLGAFLEHFCFRNQSCLNPECNTPMLDHVQHFTQTTGSVKLTLQTVEPIHLTHSTNASTPIVMWSYCSACKQTSQARLMSLLTWHLSFMKFIDFLINSPSCLTHKSSINGPLCCSAKSLSHCFSLGRVQATFCYHPIVIFEVCMPPITQRAPSESSLVVPDASGISKQGNSKLVNKADAVIEPLEMPDFLEVEVHATLKKFYELTMMVKQHLMNLWNDRQCEILTHLLEVFEETLNSECTETGIKSRVELLSFLFDNLSKPRPSLQLRDVQAPPTSTPSTDRNLVEESATDRTISSGIECQPLWMSRLAAFSYEEKITLTFALMYLIKRWLFNFANDWNARICQYNSTMRMLEKAQSKQRKHRPPPQASTDVSIDAGGGRSQISEPFSETSPSSSNLDLAMDDTETTDSVGASRKDIGEGSSMTGTTPYTLLDFLPANRATATKVETVKRIFTAILPGSSEHKVCPEPWTPSEHPQIPPPNCRTPLLLALALQPPAQHVESGHFEAPDTTPRLCANEKVVEELSKVSILETTPDVYISDQEITSIIAYGLASFELQVTGTEEKRLTGASSSVGLKRKESDCSVRPPEEATDNANGEVELGTSVSDDIKSVKTCSTALTDPHIEIQFADASTTFFCRIYYAEEFYQLRKLVLPQGEMAFIRSLSRCRNWDAQGGKSGSCFMKTHDERFVVKEVSSIEMKTFHDVKKQYFDYLISAASMQRLSLLARIFGIFHIDYKNSITGDARRLDVLVMENLFHNRPGITHIYDLKGSLRGRLIANTESPTVEVTSATTATTSTSAATANTSDAVPRGTWGEEATVARVPVLLDQNFINESLENPIYLRLHSKNALMHCLSMDTQFLADLFIMDYSLLVGTDRRTGLLVVGIIDYLRKFTLNKRLEMFVKQTLTSVQGPMPTIIMPVDYRERLLDQMERNFHLVPDQWYDSPADHREVWRL
uniref:1-phosphatidylinositol-3-phosphate 5-kinase n=1 Tax=Echinococcus granulosus TaxID=6210 RepID=A0A068WRF1_ECHGR|nr:phosphatidylinositol phosphate 5 kinase type III [Echinococcus granulosus]